MIKSLNYIRNVKKTMKNVKKKKLYRVKFN